jgi:hypothetical protein
VSLLEELVKEKRFLELQGRSQPDDDKETDRELLLRLFSWVGGGWGGGRHDMPCVHEHTASQGIILYGDDTEGIRCAKVTAGMQWPSTWS